MPPALRLGEPQRAWAIAFAVLIVFALLFLDGFAPRDSWRYALHAHDLMGEGAPRPADHWRLRWPMTGSLALGFAALGASDRTAALVCAAWVAGLVAVTLWFGRRELGPRAGTLAGVLTAGSAFCAAQAFEVRIHGFETLFGAAACWVAVGGLRTGDARRLFASGVLAGGAWLCRETAAPIPAVLGLASLAAAAPWRRGGLAPANLWRVTASSAGFLLVLAAELAAYAAFTGDPFFRLNLSANHEAITGGTAPAEVTGTAGQALASPLQQDPLAVLLTTPNVTPFLVGALVLLALVLVLRLANGDAGRAGAGERWAGVVLAGVAGSSWLFSSYVLRLEEPLYVPMLPYAVGVLAGWSLAALRPVLGRLAYACAGLWLVASAAAADLRDYDEWAESRWLADALREDAFGEPVVTDWQTARRVGTLLTLTGDPLAGVFFPEDACRGRLVLVANPSGRTGGGLRPAPDWQPVTELRPRRPSPTRALLRALPGASEVAAIRGVIGETPPLTLYRAGPAAGPCEGKDAPSRPAYRP